MRLSTERERDEAAGIAVIHAALDAGVTLLDTADAYCWDDTERGHNERLIARALATWRGDRSRVQVATKGGITRPDGRWEPDGRARHLRAACEASRRALGVDRLDLYQLHAPDPRVPLATSVRALAALKEEGAIAAIGLSNVTVGQIEAARRITAIDAIQVELGVWHDEHILSGVVEYCDTHRIPLLAYRPLGGRSRRPRTSADPTLTAIAARHDVSPFEIAIAWLLDLSDIVVPIPGATRVDTVRSIVRARDVRLTDDDRAQLDERFPARRAFRSRTSSPRSAPARSDGAEVVLVMGLPGAGKSTVAARMAVDGYHRLNRDEAGGSLRGLLPALDAALAADRPRVVLDNTYVSRASRADVIRVASARGVPVRCLWMSTSVEDAQTNAAWRIVSRYGRLPDEAELKALRAHDVAAFPPTVQFRYQRELEPPDASEGFSRVDVVPFVREHDPSLIHRALLVWCDDVLVRSRSGRRVPLTPEDAEVFSDRGAILRRYHADGWRVLGLSWQPDVAAGAQSHEGVASVFAHVGAQLGVDIEIDYCPHAAGPPTCWCRKPLPGLGVVLIQRHRLLPAQCLYVGAGAPDRGLARRLGMPFRDAGDLFAAPR